MTITKLKEQLGGARRSRGVADMVLGPRCVAQPPEGPLLRVLQASVPVAGVK